MREVIVRFVVKTSFTDVGVISLAYIYEKVARLSIVPVVEEC